MKHRLKIVSFFLMGLYCMQAFSSDLRTYPAPEGVRLNDDFIVKVRQGNGAWMPVSVYLVEVANMTDLGKRTENASMASFDFSGEVEVSVTHNKEKIESVRVLPLSRRIEPEVSGNTLIFTLKKAENILVEVNGDIFHNLHLFANPIDTYVPDTDDPNLIYFGPGIHMPKGNRFKIDSGKTVYVAGGAYLKGQIAVEHAENVKVLGRGVIDPSIRGGLRVFESKNVLVEGLISAQCGVGNSDEVVVRNVKCISNLQWGDGINVFCSKNVLIDGVFLRNSDDCTTVYGSRGKEFKGSCKNITMRNSTLWADIAHPINIGLHGNSLEPDTLEDLNYINIDILDHKERQIDYQGCMTILVGDNNLVRNVRFEDIRIDNFRQGQLLNLRISYNEKYCTAPGRGIENVLFKDVVYNGDNANLSIIAGYDAERKVKNITFENLTINGQRITDDMPGKPSYYKTSDMCEIFIGEHVENVVFK